MKTILTILTLTTLFVSCDLILNKEKKAIEVCQKAKVQFQSDNAIANAILNVYGLGVNATWLDFANMIAKQDPNKKYDWHAKITDDNKFYIVDFTDPDGWGHRWEVDIDQQIVKSINQNEYLSRKYGLSRFDGKNEFEVTEVTASELKFEKHYSYSDNSNISEVFYVIKASVLNKTTKIITSAKIDGKLKLIFKDKTVTGESNSESGFKSRITDNNPWVPNTTREFYIKTYGVDKIYLNYIPEYVVFDISLKAEDPTGFAFDKDIADMNLIESWKSFKGNSKSSSLDENTIEPSPPSDESNKYKTTEPTERVEETADSVEDIQKQVSNNEVEIEADYPGGMAAWARYINSNLRYPDREHNSETAESVTVQFKVDIFGDISNIEAVSGATDSDLRAEAVRLIQSSGRWTPAINNGRKVESVKRVSINFIK